MTISKGTESKIAELAKQVGMSTENLLLELVGFAEITIGESNLVQGRQSLHGDVEQRARQRLAFLRNAERVVEQQRQILAQLAEINSLVQSYVQVLRREGKIPDVQLPEVIAKAGLMEKLGYTRADNAVVTPIREKRPKNPEPG